MTEIVELGPRTLRALMASNLWSFHTEGTEQSDYMATVRADSLIAELAKPKAEDQEPDNFGPFDTAILNRLNKSVDRAEKAEADAKAWKGRAEAAEAELGMARKSNFHKDWQRVVAQVETLKADLASASRMMSVEVSKNTDFYATGRKCGVEVERERIITILKSWHPCWLPQPNWEMRVRNDLAPNVQP